MDKQTLLKGYFKALVETAAQGDAREESFYTCLKDLLLRYGKTTSKGEIHVTILPKKTEAGNPDFRVWNGKDRIIGYIEAKAPTVEDLRAVETSEQLQRYRSTFPNLLLTNFFEFRLYREGELIDRVSIGRPFVLHKLGQVPPPENVDEFCKLLEKFLSFSLPRAYTAEQLAVALAKRTRFLREVVVEELRPEQPQGEGTLLGFYEAFQRFLIAHLSPEDFADLYAQTIAYGLFAARTRSDENFHRRAAFDLIPRTIGILRDVFRFISLGDLPKQLEWIVDDISAVLAAADAKGILERYYREGKGSDPIVHFYETFLAVYDPEERERRGVYYTPEPVVSYIVRSLHKLLKSKFERADGLASEGVTLLDPAAGTMTFVARACQEAIREFEEKYGSGGRARFIQEHILKNYYAFELMMAPYAVGHLKMAFLLEELGYRLSDDERFPFYLTNTLEMEELEQTHLPGMASLAEESRRAGEVKKKRPILVILGNPPYSGHSSNRGEWILRLIEDYKQLDGQPLGERNPKWLQDDYVKFLRFAQWKIEQTGEGIVGMITNHSYLDNPTFRGMRRSLMKTFDEIYVLDLHGNSLKRERAPDGSEDENVFDIRQGVAIAFFLKFQDGQDDAEARVYHADLWGSREEKYCWLETHDVETTDWQLIAPKPEFYLFVPRDEAALERYDDFVKVTEIFPVHSVGIVTARDHFLIDFRKEALMHRLRLFSNLKVPDELVRETFGLKDSRYWKTSEKRKILQQDSSWEAKIVKCLHRPFDIRWLFYHTAFLARSREEVMQHMLAGENLGLIVPRRVEIQGAWTHALVTDLIIEHVVISAKTIDYLFPLYLYPDTSKEDLFTSRPRGGEREPNLNPKIIEALSTAYGEEPTPEEIFFYIYAVLYAPTYREKYVQFLRIDFPRIPFTVDRNLFRELAALGRRLVDLHLLRSEELDPPLARFEGEGDNRVARTKSQGFRYEPQEEQVYINKTQYFAPVSQELWEYQIGGYQVLEKWLKDRKERQLTLEEIRTYCRIITAIAKTIEIQEEIDALYPQVEEQLVKLHN